MTTWLARLALDTSRTDVREELRNAVAMHRRVMSLFPDLPELQEARSHFGVLHRVEQAERQAVLMVQSNRETALDRLPNGYTVNSASRNIEPLLEALAHGRRLHYRCDANPIRRPGHTTRELYKNLPPVVALHGHHADDWWHRRASLAGLKVHTHLSHPLDAAVGRRGKGGDAQKVRHHRVRFEGTAEIVDPDALRAAMTGGIGRGRSYGCGLLTIAPLRPGE
ncbi:type I-E CRISPR-associated protein Cas6/Cse3/CasE [Streptomyces sp. SL13]|uniref:Type I-E CRISPR-associated protein Cas6/Cse3/CasE n=1 Tax=Streptantibioticus silvisoli TaxID=2705255 RepID=A0AA90GZM7_9ACTN|nr:type I-E CRISPR-associated protein Cas6/Cse3/CasE [Streptantibioticus silvisoli]MDI5968611.1 type I-E CRISPR-associated protein Cas6/Cse3/CasE [Streptantibioticus silvisoli]